MQVNVSSGTSSTSMPHFSIEPPSNQNNNDSSVPVRPTDKVCAICALKVIYVNISVWYLLYICY